MVEPTREEVVFAILQYLQALKRDGAADSENIDVASQCLG
jgi:hypothetical protein